MILRSPQQIISCIQLGMRSLLPEIVQPLYETLVRKCMPQACWPYEVYERLVYSTPESYLQESCSSTFSKEENEKFWILWNHCKGDVQAELHKQFGGFQLACCKTVKPDVVVYEWHLGWTRDFPLQENEVLLLERTEPPSQENETAIHTQLYQIPLMIQTSTTWISTIIRDEVSAQTLGGFGTPTDHYVGTFRMDSWRQQSRLYEALTEEVQRELQKQFHPIRIHIRLQPPDSQAPPLRTYLFELEWDPEHSVLSP